nr:hypothetical protein [Tanacetum cinerariifolium]
SASVIDDILIYSKTQEEHIVHLGGGIHVDPSKIEVVKNWKARRTPSEDRSFLGLVGLGCVLMQRGKVIAYASRQLKIPEKNYTTHDLELELFSDYDCEIRYHPGKANVVADALSRKERVEPKRVRAMNMTLQSSIKDKLLAAQKEASDESARLQRGIDEMIELRNDGALYYLDRIWGPLKAQKEAFDESVRLHKEIDEMIKLRNDEALYYLDRIWVPLKGDVRTLIIDEAYKSKYCIHLGADKMYYDLRDRYWCTGMKKDIDVYMRADKMYYDLRDRYRWSGIKKDIAVYVSMREDYKMNRLARLYLNEIVDMNGVTISIISDRNSRFTLRFWQSMQEALGTRLNTSTAYHSQTDGQSERTIQTLEDMLRACIKDGIKTARDRQKSYADKTRKPLEFSVGDYVLLKVSPWKGVARFGKNEKLSFRFVGHFEIIEKVGPVSYRLDLPEELNGVHDTFHVSNLKKCLADPTLQVPLDEI